MLRGALLIALAVIVLAVIGATVAVRTQPQASIGWQEFSIAPAFSRNTAVNPDGIRAEGTTLKLLLSVAYDMPQIRIVAPSWMSSDLYAVRAVVSPESPEPLAALLQQELLKRLDLAVHIEQRGFDGLVLTAKKGAENAWERTGGDSRYYVSDDRIRAVHATVRGLANALQNVLARPVIDETGIVGNYNFEFPWGENRLATVTQALEGRFGLILKPGRRDLDALIVDRAQCPAALLVMSHMTRVSSRLPFNLRLAVSRMASGADPRTGHP
jgi:uncharacterized protein (TIGR03435 family)